MAQAYFLFTSPRSGSTMLCRLLAATGAAGRPEAYFHRSALEIWARGLSVPLDPALSFAAQAQILLRRAIEVGRGSNTIFGARLQGHSLPFFLHTLAQVHPECPTSKARLQAAFGDTVFFYLNREDKIGQALSYVRAEQSGLWHKATDGTEIERQSPPRDPTYDFARIFAVYQEMKGFDQTWRAWFDCQGIAPHLIRYEDLSADPTGTLRGILRAIDRPTEAAMPIADTARLSDALTERWRDQFVKDLDKTGLA